VTRLTYLANARRIVIKLGSRLLTDDGGALDCTVIRQICADLVKLRKQGKQVILVSSGAVAAGRKPLNLTGKSLSIPQKQAAAAVGQPLLMKIYQEQFEQYGLTTGQLLLTADDLANRRRFLNARSTLETLLDAGVVPIINENDTVAVAEIKFGDNDNLSALVTNLVEANLLLILTDIEGLYTANPADDPAAELIKLVPEITKEIERAAGKSSSNIGTGGMATKVAAAKKATRYGVPTMMVKGNLPGIITAAMSGEDVGTLFLPADKGMNRRKHWIAYSLRPAGKIFVDQGAVKAIAEKGTSLLPSGVCSVEGRFERGSCVRICNQEGHEFARGIADYGSKEIALIARHKSCDIESLLGYRYGDVVVHRDNLSLRI